MFSNKFLLSHARSSGPHVSTDFSVHQRSIVALFTSDPEYHDLSATLFENATRALVSPFFTHVHAFQTLRFYNVEQPLHWNQQMLMDIRFNPDYVSQSVPCPSFGLGMM
jgi:hypothetical protein